MLVPRTPESSPACMNSSGRAVVRFNLSSGDNKFGPRQRLRESLHHDMPQEPVLFIDSCKQSVRCRGQGAAREDMYVSILTGPV